MAHVTRNEFEKRTWQEMAESWLRLIPPASTRGDAFDAMDLNHGASAAARSDH
jgi:hypothetical protein